MKKSYNNMLTLSLLGGGGINNTLVCYNIKKEFKQLDSFYRAVMKEGLYYE